MVCGAEGLLQEELPAIQSGAFFAVAMTASWHIVSVQHCELLAIKQTVAKMNLRCREAVVDQLTLSTLNRPSRWGI